MVESTCSRNLKASSFNFKASLLQISDTAPGACFDQGAQRGHTDSHQSFRPQIAISYHAVQNGPRFECAKKLLKDAKRAFMQIHCSDVENGATIIRLPVSLAIRSNSARTCAREIAHKERTSGRTAADARKILGIKHLCGACARVCPCVRVCLRRVAVCCTPPS